MRTLLIIVMLVGVAAIAAASFVLDGGAQQPGATLEYTCDPPRVPANVDTLVRCRAVAVAPTDTPLNNVRLSFELAPPVPPPARWYFFGARLGLDGVPFEVDPGQTVYDLGEMAPGERTTLDLDIVLRVSAPSGALVVLSAGEVRLAQELVVIEPDDAPPPVTIELQLAQNTTDLRRFQALLMVNDADRAIDTFTADIGLPAGMSIPDAYARQQPLLGEEVFGEKFHLTTVLNDPPSPAGADVSIGFEIVTDERCQAGTLALVGYIHAPTGEVARPALLTELPEDPECYSADEVTSLGQGGFGPAQQDVEASVPLVAMLAGILGAAAVGVAIFVVR